MRLLLVAGVLAFLMAAPAQSDAAVNVGCNLAAAKRAIAQTKLRMKLLGDSTVGVAPSSADQVLCHDFTRDGRTDIAVTIASGGTAGDIGFAVFRSTPAGWQVALARDGYKLGLFRVGRDLVSSQPIYEKNDPNCCPTGGFDHLRFHWNGKRFVVARSWHTRSFHP
jgi:hypothetical protein